VPLAVALHSVITTWPFTGSAGMVSRRLQGAAVRAAGQAAPSRPAQGLSVKQALLVAKDPALLAVSVQVSAPVMIFTRDMSDKLASGNPRPPNQSAAHR
jgi:hypothetical protein